jgi:hypothetical protein
MLTCLSGYVRPVQDPQLPDMNALHEEMRMLRNPLGRVTRQFAFMTLFLAATSGVAFANDFTLSITSPTNNPVWISGPGHTGSVSWTWSGGPLPAGVSWRVRIVNKSTGAEYSNMYAGTGSTAPQGYNFAVPDALSG